MRLISCLPGGFAVLFSLGRASYVPERRHPAARAEDWFLAPAVIRAAAFDGTYPFHEASDHGKEQVHRCKRPKDFPHRRPSSPQVPSLLRTRFVHMIHAGVAHHAEEDFGLSALSHVLHVLAANRPHDVARGQLSSRSSGVRRAGMRRGSHSVAGVGFIELVRRARRRGAWPQVWTR